MSTETQFIQMAHEDLTLKLGLIGFEKSDGLTWCRLREPFIDCVELQVRSDRTACSVNVGVHFTFLPAANKTSPIDSTAIRFSDCEIKSRVTRDGESDSWWVFEDGPRGVEDLVAETMKYGVEFFEKYTDFPDLFLGYETSDVGNERMASILPMMTKVRMILLFARVFDYLGDRDRSKKWALFGLKNAGMASGPKAVFREIVEK